MDILFPPRCPICDDILEPELVGQTYIHENCMRKITPVKGPVCLHCGRPVESRQEYCFDCGRKDLSHSFRQGKAVFVYQGSIQKNMYRFKYSNKREYAEFFADSAVKAYGEWMLKKGIEAIVPVPMYGPKRRKRGYNQAESFARELACQTGIPMEKKLVRRCKDTTPQKELNDIERQKNLKSAFCCEGNTGCYKKVSVVDDIYTTGSTADAVTECLLEIGIQEVYFLSVRIGAGS